MSTLVAVENRESSCDRSAASASSVTPGFRILLLTPYTGGNLGDGAIRDALIGVNRCGSDPQLDYHGGTLVVNPWGETVAEAGRGETLFSANLDLTALNRIRFDFPVLRDVRTRFVLKKISGDSQ